MLSTRQLASTTIYISSAMVWGNAVTRCNALPSCTCKSNAMLKSYIYFGNIPHMRNTYANTNIMQQAQFRTEHPNTPQLCGLQLSEQGDHDTALQEEVKRESPDIPNHFSDPLSLSEFCYLDKGKNLTYDIQNPTLQMTKAFSILRATKKQNTNPTFSQAFFHWIWKTTRTHHSRSRPSPL